MQIRVMFAGTAFLLAISSFFPAPTRAAEGASGGTEFFEKQIRPLLVDNCYNCHSADTNAKGGLRVDDHNGLLQGGNTGPALIPGQPEKSLLIKAVGYQDDDLQMPPKKRLSAEQVADLTKWIKEGAAWPQVHVPQALNKPNPKYDKLRKEHWAWQPLLDAKAPSVKDAAWARDDIDRFVLAKLEEKGLSPVADADRLALIRRATFDLTGLPPTPPEIDAFVSDASADAFAKVVDRLLASPAFGERWGRHWLDIARYGESTGSSRNLPYPHAWRYRDYVIDSLNRDKPYNQFIKEQIAGDLLPASSDKERDEHLIATGFLALGVKDVNQRFKVRFLMDNIDEQIDTVSRSVLALTASCARCHDHKFDPIPTAEYYALAGIFNSTDDCAGLRNKMGGNGLAYYDTSLLLSLTRPNAQPSASPEKMAALKKEAEAARAEFLKLRGTPEGLKKGDGGFPYQRAFRLKAEKLEAEYAALADPSTTGPVAFGVRDGAVIGDTEIRIRGEAEKLGPVAPRGFLSVLNVPDAQPINLKQSGRLELAQWLTSDKNPLASRVFANRVWEHLFGEGIVKSVDNFGITGDRPSHPELLDFLAKRLVEDDWSTKKLIRSIVLSRTYQLSAGESASNSAVDPANRLLWRHAPRRLDAEEIRDAVLLASGALDVSRPDGSPVKELKVIELPNNGPIARRFGDLASASAKRSIYLPLLRGLVPTSLEVFDFAEQGMVTGSRDATTVATQALYLLNDPFVRRQSLSLAERVLRREDLDDAAKVELSYRLTLGRAATAGEVSRALDYVKTYEAASRDVAAAGPPRTAADAAAVASADPNATSPSESGGSDVAKPELAPAATPAADDAKPAKNGAKKAKGKKNQQLANDQLKALPEVPGSGAADAAKPRPVAQPVNPDEADQSGAPVTEEIVQAPSARAAAWASFAQALIGSAEFRYLK